MSAAAMNAAARNSADADRVQLYLCIADDHLVLGHRLSEWCGHAPMLEEELALANMGLDLLGQARALYSAAAELEGAGRDEDQIAYLRTDREYRNLLLVERENQDFAHTMCRQLLFATYQRAWWEAAATCVDVTLAAIAAKAVREAEYHVRHSAEWTIRLGDGTPESARRMAAAVDELFPFAEEMFDVSDATRRLIDADLAPDPAALEAGWQREIADVFARANVEVPEPAWALRGGRDGRHGEAFGFLLSELQYMQRTYPGATW